MINKLSSTVFLSDHVNRHGLSKLYLQIIIRRKTRRYPLEIFVEPENWNRQTCKVVKRQDKDVMNRIITNQLAKVNAIYLKMIEAGNVCFDKFDSLFSNIDRTKLSEVIKMHTKTIEKDSAKVFKTVEKNIKAIFGDISICEFDYNKICKFHDYISHLSHNTIWCRHKVLRTLINTAIKHDIYKYDNPYKKFKWTYKQPIRTHLEKQEILQIEKLLKTSKLTDRIRNTSTAFLFQCYTGLRFSDLKQLSFDHIQQNAIVLEQEKTKKIVYVPLINQALHILSKIDKNKTLIFPELPTNQKYNFNLKDVAILAGITKNLTSHVARHTFAVCSIENEIPIEIISKLLGHKDLKTTQIYATIMNPVLDKWMEKWNK